MRTGTIKKPFTLPEFRRKHHRLKDFDYGSGYAYFVTICTENKNPLFNNESLAKEVEDILNSKITKGKIDLYCYCIMPNHIHLLLSLKEDGDLTLQKWVSGFKRYSSKVGKEKFGLKKLWQKDFYDHVVRNNESMSGVAEYILNNPVRENMVENWEDYPHGKLLD